MTYTGAQTARTARERLGQALAALQQHADIPQDVMAVASNIAQSIGALFEAERASSDLDGRSSVKNALGTLGQTLALLQDVPPQYKARLEPAVEAIAAAMSALYPLAHAATVPPPQSAYAAATAVGHIPPHAPVPNIGPAPGAAPAPQPARPASQYSQHGNAPAAQYAATQPAHVAAAPVAAAPAAGAPVAAAPVAPTRSRTSGPPPAPTPTNGRASVEANIGATTESNFFVGFSGEISEGGVFLATYDVLPVRASVEVLVTLPGGFEFKVNGWVRYVRDPFDFSADSDPGMGIQFENLMPSDRELIMRFIRKRAPTFYDD